MPFQQRDRSAGRRFARQVLETGGNADAMLEGADTVYVYDYCYLMKQAADSSAQRHWLLKDVYNGTRGQGEVLLALYRCASCLSPCWPVLKHQRFIH